MVEATCSRREGFAGCKGRTRMGRFGRGTECLATVVSTVFRLVALMGVVMGSVGDPNSTVNFPAVSTNRCSDFDLSGFANATHCGSPLSSPCFDFSRCRNGPTVYVYDEECSLADSNKIRKRGRDTAFRILAKRAGVLADTYESACFFLHVDLYQITPCATTAPLWNEGRNHVMFDIMDESRDQRPSYSGSYAIEAATSQHSCYYRSGYDISVAHCPKAVFHELQTTPPDHRRYFLTFRGTLHLQNHGSEERASIRSLHDDAEGIIVAERCHVNTTQWWPELEDKCAELLPRFNAYDFGLLMNSTFCLTPAGASPGTHRLGEVLSAGCIPVFVNRDYVKPFTEEVDWSEFSLTFSPDEVPDMLRTLRSVPPEKLKQMQANALEAYWKIFRGVPNYFMIYRRVIDIVVRRIGHHES